MPQNIAGIFIHPDLGGADTRQQIVDATSSDMRERIDNRRNGIDTLPTLTSGIEDAHVPDLGGLDPELGAMFGELMMMVFGAFFQCIFNCMSDGDETTPTRLDPPRRTGDPTEADIDPSQPENDEQPVIEDDAALETTGTVQREQAFTPFQ